MSISVNGTLVLLSLLVPTVLLCSLGTAPRWFVRSMTKHALWRLRDDVVDAVRAGDLPGDHEAVRELVARVEWSIAESRSFHLLHLWVWNRAKRGLPQESLRAITRSVALSGLESEQVDAVHCYRMRYNDVAVRAILLSSWVGVAFVLRFAFRAALSVWRDRPRHSDLVRFAVRRATSQVATETSLGRSARDFVTAKGPPTDRAADTTALVL